MAAGARGPLVIVALVVAAYLPFIGGGFLTDDFVHLDRLSQIHSFDEVINAPDAFGFFRPITQASLYSESALHGSSASYFRLTNVMLHGLVLIAAFATARLLLLSTGSAALATLIFALTPKAHPMAVLWISARGELLMSLFALVATAAWIVWSRGGRRWWLVAATAAYAMAILSKETAYLLPLVLLLTPGATVAWRRRVLAVLMLIGVAGAAFLWRVEAGALVPGTTDPHYMLATPVFRWWRNARNYFWRLLPEPLVAVALLALATAIGRGWKRTHAMRDLALFSFAWIAVFLLPVLPVIARNELYLYLPAFGIALVAAHAAAAFADLSWQQPQMRVALVLFAMIAGAYQISRNREIHDDLAFSGQLVEALGRTRGPGVVLVVADDDAARRFLQDTIAGYLPAVLRQAAPDGRLIAADSEHPDPAGLVRLRCSYHDGRPLFVWN